MRHIDRFGDRTEVPIKALLGWFIVVGHDRQAHIGTGAVGKLSELDRFSGRICAGAGDHRHFTIGPLDSCLDQRTVLVKIDGWRLPGGSDNNNSLRAFSDVPVDQVVKALEIETAILVHRSHDCDDASLQHDWDTPGQDRCKILPDSPRGLMIVFRPSESWAAGAHALHHRRLGPVNIHVLIAQHA